MNLQLSEINKGNNNKLLKDQPNKHPMYYLDCSFSTWYLMQQVSE